MKWLIVLGLVVICLFSTAFGLDNIVDINLIRMADKAEVDTAYVGVHYQFQIWVENNFWMVGMSLVFQIYSEDGVIWTWDSQPEGLPEDGLAAVTIVPGSRLDDDPWDMTGNLVTETNVDGIASDSITMGGVAMMGGMEPGPLEPMYEMHFTPIDMSADDVDMICIDSAFIPPNKIFSFASVYGVLIPIQFDGPYCWPVKRLMRGDFDADGQITVGDAVEIINVVFRGKLPVGPMASGDVNCDGSTNVGDAIYLIAYIFKFGPAPGCP